jgi:hypothetical protein
VGPLEPAACRRLACDGTVTRVLVTRHPSTPGSRALGSGGDPARPRHQHSDHRLGTDPPQDPGPSPAEGLAGRLQQALARLPPTLGGAPSQPLEVGRASRVIQPDGPAQRPDRARPGLRLPRLRPAAGLGRRPPPAPLAGRRPHRPFESGPGVPRPSPGRARGRLAADPRARRRLCRHPVPANPAAPPATSQRRRTPGRGGQSTAAHTAGDRMAPDHSHPPSR